MIDDIRFALRSLVRQPGFSLVAILTLALGIGANTATFSVAYGALFKPLPGREPDRLYIIWEEASHYGFPDNTPAPANFADWRARSRSFEGMAAISADPINLTGTGEAEQLGCGTVTGDFFDVLGVEAALGRILKPSDDRPEAPRVTVLSHRLWKNRFGGDPAVLGRTIVLDGNPHSVVGVMPESYWFLTREFDVWVPFGWSAAQWQDRDSHFLEVVGRLRPDVDERAADAELATIAKALEAEYPETNARLGAHAVPLRQRVFGDVRPALVALLGAVALVLIIACVNVANLLLARVSARGREIAVRLALGAGRLRIARLLMTESLLLAGFGGLAGMLAAVWGVDLLTALLPDALAHAGGAAPRLVIACFTFALALLTGVVFGFAPILTTPREDLARPLSEAGRVVQEEGRMRKGLVVAQVGLCFCLLIAGGLMLRSLGEVLAQPLGFRPEGTLTLRTNLSPDRYREPAARHAFYDRVLEGVRALPGVTAAGYTSHLPLTWDGDNNTFMVEGEAIPAPGQEHIVSFRVVTPDYFRAVGTPVLQGREFEPRDTPDSPGVVIVNQALADRHYPMGEAVGKRLQRGLPFDPDGWLTVVGVVANAHQSTLETAAKPEIYVPHTQFPGHWAAPREMVIRGGSGTLALAPAVRDIIRSVDREQPIVQVRSMGAVVGSTLTTRRLQTILFGGFAALGLALAAIGLYGVLSYAVARRTREIGIRVALGAAPRRVLAMVVGSGMRLVLVGLVLGLAGAVTTARLLRGFLFGVPGGDPLSFIGSALLMLVVALCACLIPARRAVRVDPLQALRVE